MPSSASPNLSDLVALLRADLSQRWGRGESVRVEDYLTQHPELRAHPPELLELIEAEFRLRLHSDTPPSVDEYVERFPSISDEVRRRLASTPGPEGFTSPPDLAVTLPEPRQTQPRALPRIPGYEVEEEIGSGGMGIVYRARQLDLDRMVALKLIRTGVDAGPQEIARFRTEAKAVARLHHPNVVQIHHTGEHDGQLYFSMEYLAGGTLTARLRRGPLPVDEAAHLMERLALGVQAAHAAGVLHRDLKPGNVLLDTDGTPKVTDFGLAKLLDRDDSQTATEMVLGTIPYMSPEQAAGRANEIGPASDVHAIGVILYECLTGKHPFRMQSRAETLDRIRFARPVPPRSLRREVPPTLEAVCLKCLEKRAQDRYLSAGELAEDLRRFQEGQKTQARPLPWWRRWARRPAVVALGLLVVVLLALGTAMALRPEDGGSARKLDSALESLERGRPLALIPEATSPPWASWVLGESNSKTLTADDGSFCLLSWEHGLYELVPNVPLDRYRFRAEVRHDRGDAFGAVGLYVGRYTGTTAGKGVVFLVDLTFDDINDAGEEHERMMKSLPAATRKKVRDQNEPAALNALSLTPRVVLQPNTVGENHAALPPRQTELFHARGLNRTGFRSLALDVSPEKVVMRWGAALKVVGEYSVKSLDGEGRKLKAMPGFTPRFQPRGGAGLVVANGRASFRRVVLEPLSPVPPGKEPAP